MKAVIQSLNNSVNTMKKQNGPNMDRYQDTQQTKLLEYVMLYNEQDSYFQQQFSPDNNFFQNADLLREYGSGKSNANYRFVIEALKRRPDLKVTSITNNVEV